jgi:hypothetical protein
MLNGMFLGCSRKANSSIFALKNFELFNLYKGYIMFVICTEISEVMAFINSMSNKTMPVLAPVNVEKAVQPTAGPVVIEKNTSSFVRDDTDPNYVIKWGYIAQTIRALKLGETKIITSKCRPYPLLKDSKRGLKVSTSKIATNTWKVTRVA